MTILTPSNAFPGRPFPQHKSGQTNTVQNFLYPGAAQVKVDPLAGFTFDPVSLITGNGGFWRSDMGVTLSGNTVTQWTDQVGGLAMTVNGGGALGQTAPTFNSTAFGPSAFPAIQNTVLGSSQGLSTAGVNFASTTGSFFLLMQPRPPAENTLTWAGIYSGSGSYATNPSFVVIDSNQQFARPISTVDLLSPDYSMTGGGLISVNTPPTLLGFVWDGANFNVWANGFLQSGGTAFSSTIGSATASFFIGTPGGADTFNLALYGATTRVMNATDWLNLAKWCDVNFGTHYGPPLTWRNAFAGIPFPQHKSGQTSTVQNFLFPGAVQPQFIPPVTALPFIRRLAFI